MDMTQRIERIVAMLTAIDDKTTQALARAAVGAFVHHNDVTMLSEVFELSRTELRSGKHPTFTFASRTLGKIATTVTHPRIAQWLRRRFDTPQTRLDRLERLLYAIGAHLLQ